MEKHTFFALLSCSRKPPPWGPRPQATLPAAAPSAPIPWSGASRACAERVCGSAAAAPAPQDKDGNDIEMGLHVFFGCYFNLFRLMAKCGVLENLLLKVRCWVGGGGRGVVVMEGWAGPRQAGFG